MRKETRTLFIAFFLLFLTYTCLSQNPRLTRSNDNVNISYQFENKTPFIIENRTDDSNLKHGGWIEFYKEASPCSDELADKIYIVDYFHGSPKDVFEYDSKLTLLRKLKLLSTYPFQYSDGEQQEYNEEGRKVRTVHTESGRQKQVVYYNEKGDEAGFLIYNNEGVVLGALPKDYGVLAIAKDKAPHKFVVQISSEFKHEGTSYKLLETYNLLDTILYRFIENGYKKLSTSGTYKIFNSNEQRISEGTIERNLCSSHEVEVKEIKNFQESVAKTPDVKPTYYAQKYGNCKYCNKTIVGRVKNSNEVQWELSMKVIGYAFHKEWITSDDTLISKQERLKEAQRLTKEMSNIRINRYKVEDFCSLKCKTEYKFFYPR